jgi:glycosyltransferase involved in cell wall biosynthesis
MRITHVITRLIVGGAQENTIASVLGLRQKPGLEVDLISGRTAGPEGSLEYLLSGALDSLTIVPSLVRPIHPWKDVLALRQLTAIFRQRQPDVVHTHSGKAGVLGRLAATRAGVPIIVHTIHGPSFGAFQGPLANAVFRSAEGRAGKATTHFVSVADAMTAQYLAAGIGQPNQYTTIVSGFALAPYLAATNDPVVRARWKINADDLVIGKIARLFKLKGHDDLFAVAPELARQNPKIKFLLVGDGEWRTRFENKAGALGLRDKFVFVGLVPPEKVPPLIGIMDVLVHLSLREGLPRALPQALAGGKPVVAYACDGTHEVCKDGETGFLVKPGDFAGLTNSLLRLAKDAALRERLGQRGQELVRERFDLPQMIDSLHALYLTLAREHET